MLEIVFRLHNILDKSEEMGSLEVFFSNYNRVETVCDEWAQEIEHNDAYYSSYRGVVHSRLTYSLRILNRSGIMSQHLIEEIDAYRRYRNAVIHPNDEINVSKKKCDRLQNIADVLTEAKHYYSKNKNEISMYELFEQSRDMIEQSFNTLGEGLH